MSVFEHIPVPPRLIHKDHDDDILVSNMRSDIPTWVHPEALSRLDLSAEEQSLLHAHYEADELPDGQRVFVRTSVPPLLSRDTADLPGFDWVADYYTVTSRGLRLDAKFIPEHLEEKLAALGSGQTPRISPATRSRLAKITDRLACNLRTDRQNFCMINDLKNYFFYRKHHEHVPGIMLIEVARQAMYAQIYRSAQFKRGDVTITIKSMSCEFDDYVDANYPVMVSVDPVDVPEEARTGPFEGRQAEFYQRGKRVACINIVGLSITMKLFRRLRNTKPEPDDWFVPIKGFAPSVLFHDPSGKRIEGKLRRVSETGMDIVFPKQPQADAPLTFVICIDGIGYVDGKAQPRALSVEPDGVAGQLDMFDMSLDGKRKWCEAIKNYSHLDATLEVPA